MGLTALVLSQDRDVLEVLRRTLPDLGIQTETCTECEAARQKLATAKFEAIIIDLDDTPGALSLMEGLRNVPSVRHAIVFAITVLTEVKTAFQLGANFVLEKPLSTERSLRSFRAAQALMARERRRFYRYPVSFAATLDLGGKNTAATVTNLSEGGMAIDTAEPLVLGMMVKWSFELPGTNDHIEGKGEITWANPEGHAGVRFVFIPTTYKQTLEKWLNARAKSEEPSSLIVNANRVWRADV